jgi:hypothetical protein
VWGGGIVGVCGCVCVVWEAIADDPLHAGL